MGLCIHLGLGTPAWSAAALAPPLLSLCSVTPSPPLQPVHWGQGCLLAFHHTSLCVSWWRTSGLGMGADWCCPLLPPSSLFCSLELKIRIVVLSRHPGKSKHSWSVHTVSPIFFQPPATPNQGFCESVQQSSVTSLSIKPHGTSAHQTSSE